MFLIYECTYFQDFGIDLVSFMESVKEEVPDIKDVKDDDLIDFLHNAIPNAEITKPILPPKRKPGRPRKNPESDSNEIVKNFDDWNTQINEIFEEQHMSSDGYSSNSSEGFVPTKKKIRRNTPRKTKPNKKRKTKGNSASTNLVQSQSKVQIFFLLGSTEENNKKLSF